VDDALTLDAVRDTIAVSRAEVDRIMAEVRHKGIGAGVSRLDQFEWQLVEIVVAARWLEAKLAGELD
jgi:hypothetical protein